MSKSRAELEEKLEEVELSDEEYIECVCCDGERTETAVPIEHIDNYEARRYAVEYPCRLCGGITVEIEREKAIEWLKNTLENHFETI